MRDDHNFAGARQAKAGLWPVRGAVPETRALRILATTDLHMQVMGFDYARDVAGPHHGLAGLATLIGRARDEGEASGSACLLLDNGDLLQGAAIDRVIAQQPVDAQHPIVACLNHLRYDALGVGNHDLDHGLDYLEGIARHVDAPMICSNLALERPSALRSSVILGAGTTTGPPAPRIGLLSVLPERTAYWSARELEGRAQVLPLKASIEGGIRDLRAQGAEIVLLLAHLGVGPHKPLDAENEDVRLLASIEGIDAMVLGHTHRRLPGDDHDGFEGVDAVQGAIANRPAIMAGVEASDLAVLDLSITREADGPWRVSSHCATLWKNTADVPPNATIRRLFAPAHVRTRLGLGRPCGRLDRMVHNYFSLAAPTATCALVANGKRHAILSGLARSGHRDLPVLAAASAHTAGGLGGPHHFIRIDAGIVRLRDLVGLNPYSNALCALRITGAEVLDWLEKSAEIYTHLSPGCPDQPLLQSTRPKFNFDTIYGLDYRIHPHRPPGQRISNASHEGEPLRADQTFILATTIFRATGGGGGMRFGDDRIVFRSDLSLSVALTDVLERGDFAYPLDAQPWTLSADNSVQAVLPTTSDALAHLSDISGLSPLTQGTDEQGFTRIRLRF